MTGGETIVTTVDHTLMRGLEPHDPGFVAGLPRSMVERGNGVPLIEISRVPLAAVPPPGMGAGGMPVSLEDDQMAGRGLTCRAMAQAKPSISRAMAAVTTLAGFPAALSLR